MDESLVKPFVSGVARVLRTMAQVEASPGDAEPGAAPAGDLSGIVTFSGDLAGALVLSLPRRTAECLVPLLTGAQGDIEDAVGELTHLAGAAGAAEFGAVFVSPPRVVRGRVELPEGVPSAVVPLATECGELALGLAVQVREVQADLALAR